MEFRPRSLLLSFVSIGFGIVASIFMPETRLYGQVDDPSQWTDEEREQAKTAERFFTILEKNPRRGTAFDRVYQHHLGFGTLDRFVEQLTQRTTENPQDAVAWLLLGLFESQRGQDRPAIDAFQQAADLRPDDALVAYYRGQSLQRLNRFPEAVVAYELALQGHLARTDLLEVYQQLGRLHQRTQQPEKALDVWRRMEAAFPSDPRVLEQIAIILAEEAEFESAMSRYEQLSTLVDDDYRSTLFRMEAASLKFKTNRHEEAIVELESVLADLKPDSWLYREIRRRIEESFLKSQDQDSLVKYYERWLESHPEDLEGMSRLAKFLAASARIPEANEWLKKALQLAPSRSDLRRAYIDHLVDNQNIPDAIQQYQQWSQLASGDVDMLREWGKLVIKDTSQDKEERRKEAMRIWDQIVAMRPDDASNVAKVADYFRHAQLNEEAETYYQKAIELAPDESQYREYLGEFLYDQKRTTEAVQTWEAIAEGKRRNVENLTRLAEVYNRFGYRDEAALAIADACRMDPRELRLQIQAAEYQLRADRFEDALQFVDAAKELAENEEEHEMVLRQKIEVLQACQQLDAEIAKLANAVKQTASKDAEQWHLLARYQEADRKWASALRSIQMAQKLDAKSISILTTAARISEASGNLGQAVAFCRKLAAIDRRSIGSHLMNIARLEVALGRPDEAIIAANELIVSAPGNTDHYEFLAQMYERLGKPNEALEALRKAVRINPNEPHLIVALGTALAKQSKSAEAIELYWRAFDQSDSLDDKTTLTIKLVPLYKRQNEFQKLIDRLQRDRRDEDKRRTLTICLAQAYSTSGDAGKARNELESLLHENTRDTNLLQQLAKLASDNKDMDAAIAYQRQLVAIAPGGETEIPLASMLQAQGKIEEAAKILVELTQRESDPVGLLKSVDSLLSQQSFESVVKITAPLLQKYPDNWELLYREGVALDSLNQPAEAKLRFERLIALPLSHDTLGVSAQAKFKQTKSKTRSAMLQGDAAEQDLIPSPLDMLRDAEAIKSAVGLSSQQVSMTPFSNSTAVWTPEMFAAARMAALGWLLKYQEASGDEKLPKLDALLAHSGNDTPTKRESLYDRLYLATLQSKTSEVLNIARRLTEEGGPTEYEYFLQTLFSRNGDASLVSSTFSDPSTPSDRALSEQDLEWMIRCFEGLSMEKRCSQVRSAAATRVVNTLYGPATIGLTGNILLYSNIDSRNATLLSSVLDELRKSGQNEQADRLLQKFSDEATTTHELYVAMTCYVTSEQYASLSKIYARWCERAKHEIATNLVKPANNQSRTTSSPGQLMTSQSARVIIAWMGMLGPDREHDEILSILDSALEIAFADAKRNRGLRSSPTRSTSTSAIATELSHLPLQLRYGNEQIPVTMEYPLPNESVDRTVLLLLRECFEIFRRNDTQDEFVRHLRQRLANAQEDDRCYEQLVLATVQWWAEGQEEAFELTTQAAASFRDDVGLQFELAALYEKRGDFHEAIDIIESLVAFDKQIVQRKEIEALRLAERVGDIQRATQAAERLWGMQLDSATELELGRRLRRLGLNEMANTIIGRATKKANSKSSATRTTTRTTAKSSASALHLTGDLNKDCDRYLSMLQKDPGTSLHHLKIIERVFENANRTDELAKAILKIDVKKAPQLVNVLMSHTSITSSNAQISDVALAVFEKTTELIPDYTGRLLMNMTQRSSRGTTDPQLNEIFRRLLMASETQVATNPWKGVNDAHRYDEDGRAGGILKLLLDSYPTHALSSFDKLNQFRDSIEMHLKQVPGWLGGRAILALVDLRIDRKEEAVANLQSLFEHDATIASMPLNACWILGQELATVERTRSIALKLLERAVSIAKLNASIYREQSPVAVLAELYLILDRRDDARNLLLQQIEGKTASSMQTSYKELFSIPQKWWVANQCCRIGFPVDAIRLYRELLNVPPELYSTSSSTSNRNLDFATQCKNGIKESIDSLKKMEPNEAISQMLPLPKNVNATTSAIDLGISLGKPMSLNETMESDFIAMLVSFLAPRSVYSDDSERNSAVVAKALEERLADLRKRYPHDISLHVVRALLQIRTQSERTDEALQDLLKVLDDHPLAPLAEGERPTALQRREAALSIPLWLVARECLPNADRYSIGQQFADRALEGARRQTEIHHSVAILSEWSSLLKTRDDSAGAEEKLLILLNIASDRPRRKQSAGGTEERADRIPPLTVSQFKLVSSIASLAAEQGKRRLSMMAVREAMRGGLPASETGANDQGYRLVFTPSSSLSSGFGNAIAVPQIARTSSRSATGINVSQFSDSTVVLWFNGIHESWARFGYPADEVYSLLEELVLPASRPNEILTFTSDSASYRDGKTISLPQSLVHWASKAGKLDELQQKIEQRESSSYVDTQVVVKSIQDMIEAAKNRPASPPN